MASSFQSRKLGELVTFKTGKLDSNAAVTNGAYPFFTCSQETLRTNTFSFDTECVLLAGNNANGIFPLKYFKGKFDAYQRTYVVRPRDTEVLTTKFLYYALRLKLDEFRSFSTGAATKFLTLTILNETEIHAPPLPIQRRIAGILSAYDELIENSQRRIKILETMARSLYREWFVHFRYPGHESVPLVDSPLGNIPQGWEVKKLCEFVQFKSGFAFKTGMFTQDGEHRLVTIKNVQDGAFNPDSDSLLGELPPKLPPYCILNDGDILLSLTGNVGRVCLVYDGPFLLNQRVSKLVPVESCDWSMLYYMFREPEMRVRLEQISNGVAQQNLSPILAAQMDFICPPLALRKKFADLTEPMALQTVKLYTTIKNLRRTRDLLLPRLLSGQIDVEAMPA